jgi:hypothetical protein
VSLPYISIVASLIPSVVSVDDIVPVFRLSLFTSATALRYSVFSLSLSRFGTISFFLFLSLVLPLWSVYTVLLDDTAVFVIVSSTLVLQCIDCSAVQ